MTKVTGIILAGGRSLRFGQDKCVLKIKNKTIIETIVSKLSELCSEIILVTNTLKAHKKIWEGLASKYSHLPLKIAQDEVPYQGPLSGILAGLKASNNFYNFVVSCDVPFLNLDFAKYLISQAEGFDIVIPESLMGLEPLQAVYSKNCISRIEDKLNQGCFRIISFFEEVKVKEIGKKRVSEFDPNFLSFYNINTIKDFKKAKEIYAKSRRSDGN